MLGAFFNLRRVALALVCVGGLAGTLAEAAPALAAGPTIVDSGSMAPWIVKVAGSNFTPSNFAWVEITDVATGTLWGSYPYVQTSAPLCLGPVGGGPGACISPGGKFAYAYSPNLKCAPLGRDVVAWDFGSQKWSNKIHLAC